MLTTVGLGVIALIYLWRWWALSRRMPARVSVWQPGAFLAGLALLGIACSARLTALTQARLTAHMVQHLLLMLLAPPLLLLGSPLQVFRGEETGFRLTGAGPRVWRGLAWAKLLGRWLTHPVTAASLMVAITIAWHLPRLFALAMGSAGWHGAESATFFASGLLFWWPVILPWPALPRWPRWTIPLYLLGADLPLSVLCAYLAFCGRVVYPAYLMAATPGMSALDDQVAAAMLMWVAMLVVFLAAAVVVIVDLLEPARQG